MLQMLQKKPNMYEVMNDHFKKLNKWSNVDKNKPSKSVAASNDGV